MYQSLTFMLLQSCAKLFIWIRYRYLCWPAIYYETNININIRNGWFRNQYRYQYWMKAYFEININIDIGWKSISKSIPISIFKTCLFRTNIDINIDIFDTETDILLHKDPKKAHQEHKNSVSLVILQSIFQFFTISISIPISIFQQCLFRNQYRYQYPFHGYFDINIDINILSMAISKPIPIRNRYFRKISISKPI